MAAGLALHPDKLGEFRRRLNELARHCLKPEQLQPTLRIDAEVTPAELTFDRLVELARLQQTGIGNPPVQLLVRNVTHQRPPQSVGQEKKHSKLWITDGSVTREAIMWGTAESLLPTGHFDLAFTPQLNEFNGLYTIQLKVLDWKTSE